MKKTSPHPSRVGEKSINTIRDREYVTEHFEKQAQNYSSYFDPSFHSGAAFLFQLRSRLAVMLSAGDGPRAFLDIATGTGEITHAVASSQKFEELHLNDISLGMLQACQRAFLEGGFNATLSERISWTNEDAFELLPKAGTNRFDLILCLGVIAHTGRLSELLAESFRCLRNGGLLVLQSSLTDHPGAWLTSLFARSPLRRTRYKGNAYSKKEILDLAFATGFELDELRRYGLCIPFGDRIFRTFNYWLEAKYAERLTGRGGEGLFKLRKPA